MEFSGQKPRMSTRLVDWLDERTGIRWFLRRALDEPIPGGPRWAYVFGSGLLLLLVSQLVTGVALALYYVPSASTAHTTVAYITKQVWSGSFIRSVHAYGSRMIVVLLLLHLSQTFLYGAFKGRREILWLSGVCLFLLMLGMAFTGYLLPWDQRAYFATAVGTNVMGQAPLIGPVMKRLLRGGEEMGTLTLSRFYVLHVVVIPLGILAFTGLHILLFRKAGPAGPPSADRDSPQLAARPFYPRQLVMDVAFGVATLAVLFALAHFAPVPLGPQADPSNSQYIPRPEWYFLPLFQWLKYWEGPRAVIGIVAAPAVLFILFALVPFLDRSRHRFAHRRPFATGVFVLLLGGLFLLGVLSGRDDRRDAGVTRQLARQEEEVREYMSQPFQPAQAAVFAPASATASPQVMAGQGIFQTHQCVFCHGDGGIGTKAAPPLVGIGSQLSDGQLAALIRTPNAKMKAGGMPSFEGSDNDLQALVAYLRSLR
jgi:ubiquinol-cytochrome c reductase cytochrome b subunit